jgi:hypothetical protein
MIKFICKICGKEVWIKQYEEKIRRTCGDKKCISKWYSQIRMGKNNPFYKERIEITCPICNKKFNEKPSHANDRICCSHKCSGIYRSQKYSGENSWFWKEKIIKFCKWCGKEIKIHPSDLKIKGLGTFCSSTCMNKWRSKFNRGKNHWHWMGGITNLPYCEKFDKEFRNRVRAYFNYQCVECGTPQSSCKRDLSIHHIHYDKNSCCSENSPKLFIALCGSCHSKTSSASNRQKVIDSYLKLIIGYYQGKCFFTREEYAMFNNV